MRPISTETLDKQYAEFRKQYRIPSLKLRDEVVKNYLDHYAKDAKVKKNKELKSETIKLLEAEKALYDSYQEYYKDKIKFKVEKALLKRAGIAMERNMRQKISESLDAKVDSLGKKFSKIMKASIEKLYDALPRPENIVEFTVAAGGRYAPDVHADQDYEQFLKYADMKQVKAAQRQVASEVKATGIQKKEISTAEQLKAKLKGKLSEEEYEVVQEQLSYLENKDLDVDDMAESLEKLEDSDLINRAELKE